MVTPLLFLSACWDPPAQPTSGPGGSDYEYGPVAKTPVDFVFPVGCTLFCGTQRYFFFEPPVLPADAPQVLVYVNGYGEDLTDQHRAYDMMFQHFARKGVLVVFATYGSLQLASAQERVEGSIRHARDTLGLPPSTRYTFAGHSLGAMVALRAAVHANASAANLPKPELVVLHDAAGKLFNSELDDNAGDLDADLLVIQAAEMAGNANSFSEDVWQRTGGIAHSRNFLRIPSDDRGNFPLVSNHDGVKALGPANPPPPLDAIDWYGYWRPTEGAMRESFGDPFPGYSAYCQDAAPACPEVRDMGTFIEGPAVNKIENAGDLGI